jgi:vitamin B12 transporter
MVRTCAAVLAGGLLAATPAVAQEVKKLEPVVVTATKIETPQERLGAAVTVITGEEIEAQHHTHVADVLRQVPGVEIQRSGGFGKTTSIRIRGAGPTQVQVLVDGVRVKSPTTGEAELNNISVDQIERIEVIRGPQSTLHGADAIGGVVNIITKRGRGPLSATVSAEGGRYETYQTRASVSGARGPFDYAFTASRFESRGQFDLIDDSEDSSLTGRVGMRLPADGHLSLSLRYRKSATDSPIQTTTATPPFFRLDPDAQLDFETTTLSLQWEQKPVKWFELRWRFGQWWSNLGNVDPLTPGVDTRRTSSQINVRRREVEFVNAFHPTSWTTLTLGAEQRNERGSNRGNFRQELNTASVFVQDELRFFDRLFLSGGVRLEDNDVFGTSTTGRAGAAVLVKEIGTKLRGSWGEGFRAPTLNDLFFPGFSSDDVKPEESESWEAGVEQKLWKDRVRLGFTYFVTNYENLIQILNVGGTFRAVNVARAHVDGVEFTSAVDLLDTLTLTANYTFTNTEDLSKHHRLRDPLRRFARHRSNFGLTWDPLPRLNLFAQAHVVSSQFESATNPRNPGYHRVDAGGTYRVVEKRGPWPAVDLTARIQNLTDQSYMEVFGFRALHFHYMAGLQARF